MMYLVKRLDLATLDPHLYEAYAALTEPRYRCCLKSRNPYDISHTTQIAIGATWENKPVGLLLASEMDFLHFAELYSIYLAEAHRHRKIATEMISLLEAELIKLSCNFVTHIYSTADPTTPFLEKLLSDLNWSPGKLFGILCRFDASLFSPPWLNKQYHLSKAFHLFPWNELELKERNRLLRQLEQGVFPASVSPFGNEESTIEPLNSLGLRYKNKVVGWMITHRVAPDTIRYSALYIQREFQYRKEAIILLCEAIKLQIKSSVRWGIIEINIGQIEPSWLSFVQQRLIPYATSVTYTKQSWHQLIPTSTVP